MGGYAWVTLATNDSYSLGALVLAHSLKKSKTAHKSVVLITPAVSQPMRDQLQTVFDVVKVVDVLDSKDEAHLALMQRPELGITFTKIHCWRLVEFDKCVFLDADTLVVRNCDELFEREEFSAAPDVSWPDCFNSGVFVYKPSIETFNKLLQFAVERGSFDGGDQGLLNQFFRDWATEDIKKHLPFVYNLTSVAAYSYIPAFKHYGSETRIVHFIGAGKPWLQQLDPSTRTITPTSGSEHLAPLLQQWWDIFCEKVHPNLNKNLESNNDGMSHPPVEACSNSLPIALTDDSQTPRLIEPCTPYREKDDFRQCNLPYQPFDVMGSSGELLNVEFLLASVVHPTPPEVSMEEQQRREGEEMKVKDAREERNEKEEKNESNVRENKSRGSAESLENIKRTDDESGTEERANEEEQQQRQQQQQQDQEREEQREQPSVSEEPPPPPDPFDYDSFFPDEACINNYLERNVMTYQPYDDHHNHQHQHENHYQQQQENHFHNSSEHSFLDSTESENRINSTSHTQSSEDSAPSLPRFLTIPENDKRQSGNTETHPQPMQSEPKRHYPSEDPPTQEPEQPLPPQWQQTEERRELTKSKSMPYLLYDVTEVPSSRSIWKSQPNVNVDPNRKYSMPKLRPILPRQNPLSKSVPTMMPKVTLYTEFLMSSEYKDPADLPKDKVGFVETLIREKGQLRRSKSAADIADKFGPLPYIPSPEIERPPVLSKMPLRHLDNGLYDLSQCKRQMGNKPKAKDADRSKENNHSLPALKPLVPPAKDKKSTLIKKRKSKELSPGDGGREKMLRRTPKMPKERRRECKITPRNVSETGNGNNVDEILKRLREFSKNYQHFFGMAPQHGVSTIQCKNATVQAGEKEDGDWDTSEEFSKTFSPASVIVSRGTQTPREDKSEFRNFRNYVQEKSKTSQKGLLSIQDFVLRTSTGEDEVSEAMKVPSGSSDNRSSSVPKRGGWEKVLRGKDLAGGTTKTTESLKGVGLVERKTTAKGIPSKKDEKAARNRKPPKTVSPAKDNSAADNPSGATEPEEVVTNGPVESSSPAGESKSEEDIPKTQSLSVEDGAISFRENWFPADNSETGRSSREPVSLYSDSGVDSTKTESTATSHSHEKPPAGEEPEPETEKRLEEETHSDNPSAGEAPVAADTSSPADISSDSNRDSVQEKTVSRCRKEERPEVRVGKLDEILCVPDFDTPRSSRVPLPASQTVAVELIDEMIMKATLGKSQTSASPRPDSRKPRKHKPGPNRVSGSLLANGNGPLNDSPDGTASPVGGKTSAVAGKPSSPPPRTPPNGNALPECHEDSQLSSGIAGAIAQLSLEAGGEGSSESPAAASTAHQEYLRRQNWETGNMDYMGRDSFDNIWSKICQTLEGKEPQSEPAAVSPKQITESFDSSATVSAEEARKAEPPPVTDPSLSPSTVLQKCPEYIETLPGEPAAGPVEDDEIIFSKPDNGQPCLTNIMEEDVGTEGTALDAKPAEAGKVKLSDILQPKASSASDPKESNKTDTTGEHGKCEVAAIVPEAKASTQEVTGDKLKEEPKTPSGEKKAEELKVQPGPEKVQCQTVAICQPLFPPPQAPPGGGATASNEKSESEKKPEECTTVAIPSPPITFPGAPFSEKDKMQSKRRQERAENEKEKFDPIPLPPPESPSLEPGEDAIIAAAEASTAKTSASDSAKDGGKQNKGVFTKILEMVGVTPKEKNPNELSKSVFYDVEGAAPSKEEPPQDKDVTAPTAGIDDKKISPEQAEASLKGQTEEIKNSADNVSAPQSKEAEGILPSKPEETSKDIGAMPSEVDKDEKTPQQKDPTQEITQPCEEPKPPVEKPARNTSPKQPNQAPQDTIQVSPKSKSPSPKLILPQKPPETAITMPTPPPQSDVPARKNSALLKVDETVLETPPVPEPPKEDPDDSVKGRVRTEVEDIIGKAKSEVESLLQDRRSAEKEPGESSDLINTLKLMMGTEQGEQEQTQAQAQSPEVEVEELRVTSEEERLRHKGEVVSSKLSDQILKAIPPPRRKAISEGSASTSAIPKPPPVPEQKNVAGETKARTSKPSSIPVPPPRNRGKPTQPTPPKGKGKK